MNREYYNNLSEAYQAIYEKEKGVDLSAITKGAEKVGKETIETGKDYAQGLFKGKKISSSAPTHARAANAVGRVGNKLGGGAFNRMADMAVKGGKAAFNLGKEAGEQLVGTAKKTTKGHLKREEIEALLNSPNLTEEEKEAFIAMIEEERKDEEGMSPDEKSIGRSIKAGMNPATDHMAAATRQRLHLSQRGKKKPTAHSKETRLPAQQLKARKANDGVKEMGEEYVEEGLGTAADKLTKGVVKKTAGQVARGAQKAIKTGAKVGHKIADGASFGAGAAYQLGKNILSKEEAILSTLMDDLLDENRLTPAALEAAAAANQKRDKARGMKIHSTQGVKDLFNIKPGKV